jgi:hypothetical protein
MIQRPPPDRKGQTHIRFVGEDDDANVSVRHDSDKRAETQRVSVIPSESPRQRRRF